MISRRAFAYYVSAGAICASTLHILAVLGYAPFDTWTVIALLWVIAVSAVIAMMAHVSLRPGHGAGTRAKRVDLLAGVPEWGRRLCAAVFIYAGVNFAAYIYATEGGTLKQHPDGRYVLSDHGRFIRELDAKGVRAFHAWEVRLFSGHILPFLVLPGLYFLFAPALSDVSDLSRERPNER